MHIIKLTFLSHGWMLGIYGRPLVDEPVQAWTHGPVIPSTYYTYRGFGAMPIITDVSDQGDELSPEQEGVIAEVVDAYREYSALGLSDITHQKGTPWHQTIMASGPGSVIQDGDIEDFYRQRVWSPDQ